MWGYRDIRGRQQRTRRVYHGCIPPRKLAEDETKPFHSALGPTGETEYPGTSDVKTCSPSGTSLLFSGQHDRSASSFRLGMSDAPAIAHAHISNEPSWRTKACRAPWSSDILLLGDSAWGPADCVSWCRRLVGLRVLASEERGQDGTESRRTDWANIPGRTESKISEPLMSAARTSGAVLRGQRATHGIRQPGVETHREAQSIVRSLMFAK